MQNNIFLWKKRTWVWWVCAFACWRAASWHHQLGRTWEAWLASQRQQALGRVSGKRRRFLPWLPRGRACGTFWIWRTCQRRVWGPGYGSFFQSQLSAPFRWSRSLLLAVGEKCLKESGAVDASLNPNSIL